MLKTILKTIASGAATSQSQLAKTLDVPEPLLAQMVAQLAAQGYLMEGAVCVEGCEGCALHMRCGSDRTMRVWTLTEKGLRAIPD